MLVHEVCTYTYLYIYIHIYGRTPPIPRFSCLKRYMLQLFSIASPFFEGNLELSWGPTKDQNMCLIVVSVDHIS